MLESVRPSILHAVCRSSSPIRSLIVTAARSRPDAAVAKLLEWTERTGSPVFEPWGMTELPAPRSSIRLGRQEAGQRSACRCRAGSQDRRRGRNADKKSPEASAAELMIKGPAVMAMATRQRKSTNEAIRPDGWTHTGDIATADDDGDYTIVDRKEDMILDRRLAMFTGRWERVLCTHPSSSAWSPLRCRRRAKGELAKAYVTLKPGASTSARSWSSIVAAICRLKLPRAVNCRQRADHAFGKDHASPPKDVDDGTLRRRATPDPGGPRSTPKGSTAARAVWRRSTHKLKRKKRPGRRSRNVHRDKYESLRFEGGDAMSFARTSPFRWRGLCPAGRPGNADAQDAL